jgi:PAS domain S-box-containing protein
MAKKDDGPENQRTADERQDAFSSNPPLGENGMNQMEGRISHKIQRLTRFAIMFNLLGTILLGLIFDRHPAFGGRMFSIEGFTPAMGAKWTSWHIGVHVSSDIMTGLSWMMMARAIVIVYLYRKNDIPRSNTLLYVALFFSTAGLAYWFDAMMFYQPCYRLLSYVKFIVACLSSFLAIVSISATPKILVLKTPHQLELEVKKRTRVIDTILENVGLAVVMIDDQGNIAYANSEFFDTTGYSHDECIGSCFLKTIRSTVDPTDPIWVSMHTIATNLNEDRFVHRSGRDYVVEFSMHAILDDGKFESAVLSFRDISWLKEKEIEIREALIRAEHAIQTKDRFIAMVSHELRTPMTPIVSLLSSLMIDDTLSDDLKETIKMIEDNTKIEIQLIDDLLDVMRISQGKLVHTFDIVDVHVVIGEALVASCSPEDFRTIKLTQHLDAPYTVMKADSVRLRQVFWNIVRNAIKFMPRGGDLSIVTKNRFEGENAFIVIAFTDTGVGIPGDQIGKIFNTFEQGDSSMTRRFGGLGLGLAISKSIVLTHHGSIFASSPGTGQGATITIELPIIKDMSPVNANTQEDGKPLRLLYAEDTKATYSAFIKSFRSQGIEVTHVTNCEAALELIRSHSNDPECPWDVLLCDMQLPDGWGTSIMEEIKLYWKYVEGVAYSGYTGVEDVERSLAAGFRNHLPKPIPDFMALVRMLRMLAVK